MKEKTLRTFGLKKEQGPIVKTWAFNQGFYNLFLALGLFYSIGLIKFSQSESGKALAEYILVFICGAGIVLFYSNPKKWIAALLQGMPALLSLICFSLA